MPAQPERLKLTKTVVEKLSPTAKERVVWDTVRPGFGVRIQPSGATSFVVIYRAGRGRGAPMRKVTIGAVGEMTVDVARDRAETILAQARLGEDPVGARKQAKVAEQAERAAPTVTDVLDRFVSDHVRVNLKDSTRRDYERLVEKILKPHLGAHKARELRPQHVGDMHHALRKTRTQADAAVRVLSSAMKLAEQWGLREPGSNPCGIRKFGTRRRERLFSDVEVARLLNATDELEAGKRITPYQALAVRLLFATGCRASEIGGLEWRFVDFDAGVLRWEDTKTGFLVKPMTSEARGLLEAAPRTRKARFVCTPGEKALRVETLESAVERVMKHAGVEAMERATCHLVRHWFCTKIYSDPTIPLPEQMRICGHKSVATAMRYAHSVMENVNASAEASAQRRAAALAEARKRVKSENVVAIGGAGR
ncbi:tyrosine-type recombinase/integrase [Salinarimonas sp. NSM]|uniref:tyrosine-type recombinase/integrase n=1 Tax=Salinarimonas sp. NSM TaxID=3458003 RepID=UPI0040359416